jgi:hypothetical protein
VRLLLEHGADINARNDEGMALSQLAWDPEVIQLLSEYGGKFVE